MKAIYSLSLMVAVAALLALGVPAYASKTDDSIESSAKKSYVFKTYLKEDDIKIDSENGVVTLTGTVSEEHHKSLAQETVEGLAGVKSVDNKLEVKGERPAEKSDAWITAKVKTTLLFHKSVSSLTEVTTTRRDRHLERRSGQPGRKRTDDRTCQGCRRGQRRQ